MRALIVAVLAVTPACDQVFGLDRADAAVQPSMVTGRWMLASTTNNTSGIPISTEIPVPGAAITVQFGDELPTGVAIEADGTFAFSRPPGAAYRLDITSDLQSMPLQIQHDAEHLERFARRYAGRFDRTPVTRSTTLTFNAHAIPGERVIQSTGLWTESPMGGDSMDWHAAGSVEGTLGLLDANEHDRLWYVIRQTYTTPATYTAIAAEAAIDVTLADGQPMAIPIAPTITAHDACAQLVALRAADLARIQTAVPFSVMASDDWNLMSVPAPELGPVGVLTLARAGEAAIVGTNATYTVAYRNPFPGTTVLATMGALVHRNVTYPGATTPLSLGIGDRVWTPVVSCQQPVTLAATQAIPGTVTVDGVELAADGVGIHLPPASRATFAWNLAASGPNDLTTVTIYEVVNNGGTTLTPVRSYVTFDRTVSVETEPFLADHYYVIQLDGVVGFPGAKQGDLRTIMYPFGTATQFSRMFRVVR